MKQIWVMRLTIVNASLLNVPDGRLLHDVPHLEPLDGLVLRPRRQEPRTDQKFFINPSNEEKR